MATVRKRAWKAGDEAKVAWIADYFDREGKRHIKTFKTQRAAKAWLLEAQHEVRRGIHTPESTSITVAEAARLWLKRCEADGLEPSTIAAYRYGVDNHLLPVIGDMKLARLTAPAVEAYKDKLVESGASRSRTGRIVGFLKAILSDAFRRGLVAQNVAAAVRRGSAGRRHEKQLEIGVQIPSRRNSIKS
jgi:integrase